MNLSGRIPSLLVSATAIVTLQAEAVVAQGLEASEIENIAERITVRIVRVSLNRPNTFDVTSGSGVIFKKENNSYYVLTNAHVVRNNREQYKIRGHEGTQSESQLYNAEILERNDRLDLAILRFTSSRSYRVAEIGYNTRLSRASNVYVMGWRNLGERARRYFRGGSIRGFLENLIIYDHETYGGMSGGPVLDQRALLVGIHKGLRAGNEGEREGISIDTIVEFVEEQGIILPRPYSPSGPLPSCADVLWGRCLED